MRDRPCADCFWSNWGDLSFSNLSMFQITASALNSEPSWNFTPWRRLKIQRFLSASSTFQDVASDGTRFDALSAFDRSHSIREL